MPRIIGDLDELITTIEHAARGEVRQQEKNAERRAGQILEEARQEADRVRDRILGRARAEADAQQRQQRADTLRTARHDYLTAREDLLDQVWQQAEQHLRTLPDDAEAYLDVLRQLVWLALRTLGPGQLILAADPQGHDLLTEKQLETWQKEAGETFEGQVSLERAAEPVDTWGGLVITEADSRRRVDATFPTRLEIAREEIRDRIFQRLVQES